jgi:hypothetical protein
VAGGRAGLASLPGVGPWTLEYIALRGLGDPDGFPVGDAGLRLAFPGDLRRASEAWRPWRGYAAAHLWQRHARRDPTAPTARAAPTRTRARTAAHSIPKGASHAPASSPASSPQAFRAP